MFFSWFISSEIWMLVNTEERERRKQSRNAVEEVPEIPLNETDPHKFKDIHHDQDEDHHQDQEHGSLSISEDLVFANHSSVHQVSTEIAINDLHASLDAFEKQLPERKSGGDNEICEGSEENLKNYENFSESASKAPVQKTLVDYVKANETQAVER